MRFSAAVIAIILSSALADDRKKRLLRAVPKGGSGSATETEGSPQGETDLFWSRFLEENGSMSMPSGSPSESPSGSPSESPSSLPTEVPKPQVRFGTYEQSSDGCRQFSPLLGAEGTFDTPLSNGGTRQRIFATLPNPFPWFGFSTINQWVSTEGYLQVGPSAIRGRVDGSAMIELVREFLPGVPAGAATPSLFPGGSDDAFILFQETNCSSIWSYENVPFQADISGGIIDGTFINAQVEFYYTGDVELRWGTASLPTPPPEGQVLRSGQYDISFYVQQQDLATGNPFLSDGTLPQGVWPTNQCRYYQLVRPDETDASSRSLVESELSSDQVFIMDGIESFTDMDYEVVETTEDVSGGVGPLTDLGNFTVPSSSRRRTLAEGDFGFVEFGTYVQEPVNQNCGSFQSLAGLNNTIQLQAQTFSFGLTRIPLNAANVQFPWYGAPTETIVVTTELIVLFGPSADPRLNPPPFNTNANAGLAFPFGFGRQGFLPSASSASRIFLAGFPEFILVSFENIPFNVDGGSGFVNAQMLLYFNGDIEMRWGSVELPNYSNGEQLGAYASGIRDGSFYVQDFLGSSGAPMSDNGDGIWQPGEWPENQCRFFELVSRDSTSADS